MNKRKPDVTRLSGREIPALGLSIPEAARALGLPESTVRRRVDGGDLPAYKIGKHIRISFDRALQWLNSQPAAPQRGSIDGRR
jgi:excisionase family DNA binding protein